jgi:hydroxymethylpyrimidine/phosphomethylpyrimidine kinase
VVTALTVQDNDRVYGVQPVDAGLVLRQARAADREDGDRRRQDRHSGQPANAEAIAASDRRLRERQPALPVVLDPVLASGHGDPLRAATLAGAGAAAAAGDGAHAQPARKAAPASAARAGLARAVRTC